MKNLKIKHKLLLGFSLVVVLSIIVGLTGTAFLINTNNVYGEILTSNTGKLSALGDIRESFLQQRLIIRSMSSDLNGNHEENIKLLRTYEAAMLEAISGFESYEGSTSYSAYDSFKSLYLNEYAKLKENFISSTEAGDAATAAAIIVSGSAASQNISTYMQEIITVLQKEALETTAAAENGVATAIIVQCIIIILSAILAAVLALYFSKAVSEPILQMSRYMRKVSSTGDMELTSDDTRLIEQTAVMKDEIGECVNLTAAFVKRMLEVNTVLDGIASGDLATEIPLLSEQDTMGLSLHKMIDTLNGMLGEISGATGMVANGSRQVSDGSQALAQGSSQQAAAIEELSSSIARIAKQTEENAKMSQKASEQAAIIKTSAETGSRQMDGMLEAVKEIQNASMSIGKVIKVIDDIAFQTNILALNAAVEAARAGQHGKGFAVVAEEVRNLAAKSAEAAKDTESLIADSMQKSELGARIAADTAESLSDIVRGISESGEIVQEIARSSEEQAAAIGQINCGIDQVAQVVHQNNATAQESASAAEEMSEQSDTLNTLASRFKLKEDARKGFLSPGEETSSRSGSEQNSNASRIKMSKYNYSGN